METLDYIPLNLDLQNIITSQQAWHYGIVPKEAGKNQVEFYIDEDKTNFSTKDELEMLLGKNVILEKSPSFLILGARKRT